jgi:hypothetical protein
LEIGSSLLVAVVVADGQVLQVGTAAVSQGMQVLVVLVVVLNPPVVQLGQQVHPAPNLPVLWALVEMVGVHLLAAAVAVAVTMAAVAAATTMVVAVALVISVGWPEVLQRLDFRAVMAKWSWLGMQYLALPQQERPSQLRSLLWQRQLQQQQPLQRYVQVVQHNWMQFHLVTTLVGLQCHQVV